MLCLTFLDMLRDDDDERASWLSAISYEPNTVSACLYTLSADQLQLV